MVRNHFTSSKIVIENGRNDRIPVYVPNLDNAYELGCRIKVPLVEAINRTVDYYKEQE